MVESPTGAALSRDLSDFLIELSIALHKHAMYPADHPLLPPAAEGVSNRVGQLLSSRSTLSLGVARNQLVIEGVATDETNPVLSDLAGRLHAHQLGAVTFNQGANTYEVELFLKLVAVDPGRSGKPLGRHLADPETQQPHIKLYPVAYDRLQLVPEDGAEEDDRATRAARTKAAQLWVGLARAAMAIDDEDDHTDPEPSVVAEAISSHERGTAYDQVIVGYLLQIAEEVKAAGGSEAVALNNRVTKLVTHLDPSTLRHLLEMGGDGAQRRKFLRDAAHGMSAEAVIKLATAASETQGESISHSLLRILEKLAHHAEAGDPTRRALADQSVRDQITDLIQEWSLADPNPDEYTLALSRMARSAPMFKVTVEQVHRPEPERLVQMALEVKATGPTVMAAVDDLVGSHRVKWLVDTVDGSDAPEVASAIWSGLATTERLETILRGEPLDTELLDGLLPKLGVRAGEAMIDALIESDSRQTRRILLDRLVKMGPEIAPLAVARLADTRWFVQRNMLAIIGELPELPEGFRPQDFFEHPDERVRREAFRIMIQRPDVRERAICRALADADERTVRLALAAARGNCPKAALSLVISKATAGASDDQRVAAIGVLAASQDPAALDILLKLAAPRKVLFGTKPPPKTASYLAVLQALRQHLGDARARAALDTARESKDPEVVEAAGGRTSRAPVS